MDDLVAYFTIAPAMPPTQIRNIVAMRRAHGRPLSIVAYEMLRDVLETFERYGHPSFAYSTQMLRGGPSRRHR
jgi:hypothetical protein